MSDLEVTYGTGGVSLVDWLQLRAENETLQAKLKVAEEAITNNQNWSWYKWRTKDE